MFVTKIYIHQPENKLYPDLYKIKRCSKIYNFNKIEPYEDQ